MFRANVHLNPRVRDLRRMLQLDTHDMRVMAGLCDTRFRSNEAKLFASEGSSGGERWRALSTAYAKQKRRRFPGRKILAQSGSLRRSLTNLGADHWARWVLKPVAVITLGTLHPVAVYHAPGPRHNSALPVRDPIQHTPGQMHEYLGVIRAYFTREKLARATRALAAWRRFSRGAAAGG